MENFNDKVLGCWLGKCIGGNIGAPLEGMKQRMPIVYSPELAKQVIPNDDLDLQILWLDLLEEKGWDITSEDLAKAFYDNCPYSPGEYAYFKKNYEKGIMPPLSGSFNNEFFYAGMGSPIRSEIWACVFADDIQTAIRYAKMDAELDHHEIGVSVDGEVFLTALECLCFQGGDAKTLVKDALAYLPENSELKKTLTDVLAWCETETDMAVIQDKVLRFHGHSESCMAKENIAFLVAAFLLHGENFVDGIMEAVRCGFDADCTGASLGSVLGILLGGKKLQELFEIEEMYYKLGVKSPRTDFSVSALTKDVVVLAEKFRAEKKVSKRWHVKQTGNPCISFGEEKTLTLEIKAPRGIKEAELFFEIDAPAEIVTKKATAAFKQSRATIVPVTVCMPNVEKMPDGVKGSVLYNGEKIATFGVSARKQWKVYGPYWKNEVQIPTLDLLKGERYGRYIFGETREEKFDHMRLFHLSCIPDHDLKNGVAGLQNEPYAVVETETDVVKLAETTHFHGNSVYYFETEFFVEKEMKTDMQFGKNTPLAVWLNGELLAERDGNETFYYEVIHKQGVQLQAGVNKLLFKVVKNTEFPMFSYQCVKAGPCSDHRTFETMNGSRSENK